MSKDSFHQQMADKLWQSAKETVSVEAFSDAYPEMTLEDSRKIQQINIDRRIAEGHKIIGKK